MQISLSTFYFCLNDYHMATIAKLITDLAKKGNIDLTDAKYAALLSSQMEVPDELATALDSTFMTADVAKQHPDITAHFNAKIFNGMDAKVKALAAEYELDATQIGLLDAEKNSYEKLKLLQQFTKATTEKRFEGLSKSDKAALADQIKQLNADIVKERESAAAEIQKAKAEAESSITNYALESQLAGKNYANKDLAPEINVSIAKQLLQTELAKKGAAIMRKDGKLVLVNATTPDVNYIENNKEVSLSDLTDSILASNKLTAVSGSQDTGQHRQYQPQNNNQDPNRGKQPDNSKVLNAIQNQLQQFGMPQA